MSNTNKTYLTLLSDTVQKKERLLEELILDTIKQAACFQNGEFDEDTFNQLYDKKMEALKEIESLDDGFVSLFERVRDDIKTNRQEYETEIKDLQERIKRITEKGLKLQRSENDNKLKFDHMLQQKHSKIKEYNISKKSAAAYYNNMMKQFSGDSVFYTQKK